MKERNNIYIEDTYSMREREI